MIDYATTREFYASFSGTAPAVMLAQALCSAWRERIGAMPGALGVNFKDKPPSVDWIERWYRGSKRVMAYWGTRPEQDSLSYSLGMPLKVAFDRIASDEPKIPELVERLAGLPFELFATAPLRVRWGESDPTREYRAPGFSDGHYGHGWGCAFKGAGHDRLVSRRWLEYGPWRLVRGPEDVSLVLFHDLGADCETSLEQAKVGHRRMGIGPEGGYIQTGFVYCHDLQGLYEPSARRLDIVVHGREVSQREMLEACAVRHYQRLGPTQPIDSVAYVFMEEEAARAHLHELWLRELECWTILQGRKVRLDLDYAPKPERPAWVLASEASWPA